ncbi:unnamed protein product [marine sediment metagenome]|uniref:Uncharacterized protein n=1 Tax=marine sediment metagenome TaxID=412755 RepID=X1C688_9ZZZZ
MDIQWYHFVVYAVIAFSIAYYFILKKNPQILESMFKKVLFGSEWIERYQEGNRDKLKAELSPMVENCVRDVFTAKFSEFQEKFGITVDYDEMGKHVRNQIDSWYANLNQKAHKRNDEAEQYVKESAEYMNMNHDNGPAMDAIKQGVLTNVAKGSPMLAGALQLLMAQGGSPGGNNNDQRRNGGGGYG